MRASGPTRGVSTLQNTEQWLPSVSAAHLALHGPLHAPQGLHAQAAQEPEEPSSPPEASCELAEAKQALEGLGLPVTFGKHGVGGCTKLVDPADSSACSQADQQVLRSQTAASPARKKRKARRRAAPSRLELPWLWQQAWDESTSCFYYYRTSTQVLRVSMLLLSTLWLTTDLSQTWCSVQETQWHVPAEGFTPWQCYSAAAAGAEHSSQPASATRASSNGLAVGHLQGSPKPGEARVTGLAADLMGMSLGSHTRFGDSGAQLAAAEPAEADMAEAPLTEAESAYVEPEEAESAYVEPAEAALAGAQEAGHAAEPASADGNSQRSGLVVHSEPFHALQDAARQVRSARYLAARALACPLACLHESFAKALQLPLPASH